MSEFLEQYWKGEMTVDSYSLLLAFARRQTNLTESKCAATELEVAALVLE